MKKGRYTDMLHGPQITLITHCYMHFAIIPMGIGEVQESRHLDMDSTDQKITIERASISAGAPSY